MSDIPTDEAPSGEPEAVESVAEGAPAEPEEDDSYLGWSHDALLGPAVTNLSTDQLKNWLAVEAEKPAEEQNVAAAVHISMLLQARS